MGLFFPLSQGWGGPWRGLKKRKIGGEKIKKWGVTKGGAHKDRQNPNPRNKTFSNTLVSEPINL